MTYVDRQRQLSSDWKQWTATLPDDARVPASYVGKSGEQRGPAYDFCLPPEHASWSLLPEVREPMVALFAELGIPWHASVAGGPSNHLLSSQVQCVNALGQMVSEPDRLRLAFAGALGTAEVLEIEPGRFLTFEYIGPADYFGEAPRGPRVRGAHCTSVDAAFLHRTVGGLTELVLLEWKYTESYSARRPDAAKDAIRRRRYGQAWGDPTGPINDALAFGDLLDEPLYQLMRQQLLADALERDRVHGADRVRIVHVSPQGNTAYQQSLRPAHRALGDSVSEVWSQLLRRHDHFKPLDSAMFLDEEITSREYVLRYSPDVIWNAASLLSALGIEHLDSLDEALHAETDFDGDAIVEADEIYLAVGDRAHGLPFPLTARHLYETAREMQVEAEEELADP